MPSMTRLGRPPRSLWPQVATAFAALLLSGAACAEMVGGLLVSPTSLNFGSVALGATSAHQLVTVTNTTSAPIGPLNTSSGVGAPWGAGAGCGGQTLPPGASCSNSYTFTPTALGAQTSSGEEFLINGVHVPLIFTGTGVLGLSVSPTSINFGDVIVGSTSAHQLVTVTNTTSAPIGPLNTSSGVGAPWGAGAGCGGQTLPPGASCSNSYTFTPMALGAQTSSGEEFLINGVHVPLTFTGNGVSSIAPGSLLVTPSELNFGDVPVGATSAVQNVTVTNVTGSPIGLSLTGGGLMSPFGSLAGSCGATLAAGASCTAVVVNFSPAAVGAQSTSNNLGVNGTSYLLNVKGVGVSGLVVSPLSLDFGATQIGSTSPSQAVAVTNATGLSINLSITGGGLPLPFNATAGSCGATLAPGASCTALDVSFSPTAAGVQSGANNLGINGVAYALSASGIGINPGQPLVAPTITSAQPPGGTAGAPYNFIVTATGTTAFTFSDAGTLPPGLTINPSTGSITGTPSAAGSYNVTLTAANGILPNGVQAFTMNIALAPAGSVTAVPTLGEWGLLLMACLVGGAGWWQVRRRTTSGWPAP